MTTLTIDELRLMLCKALGEDESTMPTDFVTTPLVALGVDSLALIETVGEVGHSKGVRLGDADLTNVTTPGDLLGALNGLLQAARQPAGQ